jgi:hypothetical protein
MHPLNPEDLEALTLALPHMRTPKLIDEVTSCILTGKMLPEFYYLGSPGAYEPKNVWQYVEYWAHAIITPMRDGSLQNSRGKKEYISHLMFSARYLNDHIPAHP